MKSLKTILLLALLLALVTVLPASAQLGDSDVSSFTVQNIGDGEATVSITFIDENGVELTPLELNGGKPNPFTLGVGESFEIYLPGIPTSELPSGRYSVIVSANEPIAAIANLVGQGSPNFNGSYSGFSAGNPNFYLPAVVYNYFGWYSLISVQNVGTTAADINITIICTDGSTGTLSATDVPAKASVHFDLETTLPSGFTTSKSCNGSAEITADQNIVVVDNQTNPNGGNTQSYSGVASGASKLYVPALYTNYFGWNSSINIRKLGLGDVTVEVNYSDGGMSTCNLTNSKPSCLLYMPSVHTSTGYYGATIEATGGDIVAVVNAANSSQAQTYNAVDASSSTKTVGIPSIMKSYFGWNTSFTCQNVGTVNTSLNISYDGFTSHAYNTATLSPGETVEIFQPSESFLPSGHQGGATITANASGALTACVVNFNNPGLMSTGDWSMSYNAFNQ